MKRRTFTQGFCMCILLGGCVTSEKIDAAAAGTLSPRIPIGYRPNVTSDEAGLWMVMQKAEENVKGSGHLLRDRELTQYVRDMACRLGGDYCRDIRVYIVRTPHFNATMAPNGMMQVWSGLLLRCKNESQLAVVLGHEIGHYIRAHTLERFRDVRTKSDVSAFLSIGLAVAGLGPVADLANLALLASIYAFNRDQEREADFVGLKLVADAGYDPAEGAQVWRQLIKEHDASEEKKSRDLLFATHPAPAERVDNLERLAAKLGKPGASDGDYQHRLRTVRPVLLADELKLRQYKRTEVVLDTLLEQGEGRGELLFAKGEVYRLRDGEGDRQRALDTYAKALNAEGCPPDVYRSIGTVHMRERAVDPARDAFRKYLELSPNASDRELIGRYISGPI